MDNLLLELVSFLRDPKLQVRQIAIENLLGQTKNDEVVTFLESNLPVGLDLWHLALNDHPLVAHGAISILINLTSTPNSAFVTQTYKEDWVPRLASDICNEQFILADIAAMLLSNLTKYPEIARQLDGETLSGLVSIFVKGEGKTLNKLANYDFLANVFANVTSTMQGRRLMMETMLDGEALLASLLPFLQHSSLIRRGGVLSTIK
jgi:hypothetical protein